VLVGIGALTAGAFLCEDAIQSWSALHLERGLGASPGVSGLGPGLFAAAMAAGRLAGGPLSRRYAEPLLLGVAGSLLAVGALVLAAAPTTAVALAGLVVAGAGTSVLAPVLYSAVGSRAAAGRQGADLAAVSVLGYVGFVAGPPLVGALSAATSLPVALGCLSAVGVALAVGGPLLLSGKMAA
jgi:MFS family permease